MVGGILNINDMQKINLNGNKHDDKLDSVRYTFEKIAKKIVERQDNAMAMEFTKTIGKLLLDNNVKPVVVENKFTAEKENSITQTYGVAITELDFTEHDKPFKDKIAELETTLNHKFGDWDKMGLSCYQIVEMQTENEYLKAKISALERQLEEKEDFSSDIVKKMSQSLINVGRLKGVDTAHKEDDVVVDCKYSDDYTLAIYLGQLLERKEMEIKVTPSRIQFLIELLHI